MNPGAGAFTDSTLLYLRDSNSGLSFLCDTGAHASMVPALPHERSCVSTDSSLPRLENVSGEAVRVFGRRSVRLCFDGREYCWDFVTADTRFHITV